MLKNEGKTKKPWELFLFIKFPQYICGAVIMKNKIVEKATDMFLSYGFKSITMDDISSEMGISKKTLYQHFKNKSNLIEICTFHLFDIISYGIENIRMQKMNPIAEIYEIKAFAMKHLKNEKSSPHYQLRKYYPNIYNNLNYKQYALIARFITDNLKQGTVMGFFRPDINIDIISKFYFNGMMELKNTDIFTPQKYSMPLLMETYLEYHIRAIATPKGIEVLNQLIKK